MFFSRSQKIRIDLSVFASTLMGIFRICENMLASPHHKRTGEIGSYSRGRSETKTQGGSVFTIDSSICVTKNKKMYVNFCLRKIAETL